MPNISAPVASSVLDAVFRFHSSAMVKGLSIRKCLPNALLILMWRSVVRECLLIVLAIPMWVSGRSALITLITRRTVVVRSVLAT